MSVLFPPSPVALFDDVIEYSKFAIVDGLGAVPPQVEAENLLKSPDDLTDGAYWTEDGVTVTEPTNAIFRLTKTAAADKSLVQTMTNWFLDWAGEVSRIFWVKSDDLTALSVTMVADGADAVTSAEVISGNANVAVVASIANITSIDGTLSKIRVSCSMKAWSVSVAVGFYPDKANTTAGYVDVTLDQVILGDQPTEKPRPTAQEAAYPMMAYRPNWRLTADGNGRFSVIDAEGLATLGEPTAIVVNHATATAYAANANCQVSGRFTCEDTKYIDVFIRYTDANNWVKMRIHTTRQVQLIKNVASSATTVDTGTTLTDAELYRYRIVADESSVKIYIDDKLDASGAITDHQTVAQGRVEHDLASNDLRVVAESSPIVPTEIIIAGGKATPANGDPLIGMTQADGSAFASAAGTGLLISWTPWTADTIVNFGFDSNVSGQPLVPRLITASGAGDGLYQIEDAAGAKTLGSITAGTEQTDMLMQRSGTHGHHVLQHTSGKEWKRLFVDTSAEIASGAVFPVFMSNNCGCSISSLALLDLSAYATADFAEVTDSKSAPPNATTFNCDADCHIRTTFTVEDTKYSYTYFRVADSQNLLAFQITPARQLLLRKLVANSWTTVFSGGNYTDGVEYTFNIVPKGSSVKIYVDSVLITDSTITEHQTETGGQVAHNLTVNDIELETHPHPALGGQLGATDRVICPQEGDTDTTIRGDKLRNIYRNVQVPGGERHYFWRGTVYDASPYCSATVFMSNGALSIREYNAGGSDERITAGAATFTDGDDIEATADGADLELFVEGVSEGTYASALYQTNTGAKLMNAIAMDGAEFWDLKPLLPFNLPD